jgi:predicted DCC family thiol-disulfide oxidoreductase YuxK
MTSPEHCAEKTTVFFDGACPLCRAEIEIYRAHDTEGALVLVDISAPDAAMPEGIDRGAVMARFHVRSARGEIVSGAAAFAEVWKQLPAWRWAGRLASLPPLVMAMELLYRLFLNFRPRIVRRFVKQQEANARRQAER